MYRRPTQFHELPAEVLEDIFSYLSSKDLVQVVYVCKASNMSGGPLLYRHINLRSDDRYVEETVDFLRNNKEAIGIKILSAAITTRKQAGPLARKSRHWLTPDFAATWTRLQSLELSGVPFFDPADARRFFDSLGKYCPNLKNFTYRPGRDDEQIPSFKLVGLKKVVWQSNLSAYLISVVVSYSNSCSLLATTDLPVISVMEASLDTLTHISFAGTIAYRSGGPYEQFLKLRIPNLIFLELGSLEHTNSLNKTKTAITKFILAHPKIEHLSLGQRQPLYFMFQFDLGQLKPDSLPALKSFEGFPENIVNLIRVPVFSFFSVSSLSISCAEEGEDVFAPKFNEMLAALDWAEKQGRRFNNVQYLRCDFRVPFNHMMPTHVTKLAPRKRMDQLWHWFPNVVNWRTCLLPMTAVSRSFYFAFDSVSDVHSGSFICHVRDV